MNGQTYANHVHRPVAWSLTFLAASICTVLLVTMVLRAPSLETLTLALLAATVVAAVAIMRRFALRLQDRIIRLEMQVRLARLGQADDLARLSFPQVVALRFAPDSELAGLIDRACAEKMSPDQIKRAVKQWQGDYMRT